MSLILMDVPTLKITGNDLQNFVSFIYKHEQLLKEFGAIKVQLDIDCKLALKRRRTNIIFCPTTEQIVKIDQSEPIYYVKKVDHIDESIQQYPSGIDEHTFWSSLPSSTIEQRPLNISLLPNKSFFCQRSSRICFDIHRLPNQSLLKLGGTKLTRQFVPCLKRAYGPGSIFPLTSDRQHLFSINYHHEGGNHHWYIIPTRERDILRKIIHQKNSSICLDHGQLFINPSLLDKNHIRYHRIIQHPNEFVVLSAGTLAQSFTEDASWTESISFALPSWIEEGHANLSTSLCQCHIHQDYLSEKIDLTSFRHELIQKYIISQLNINNHEKSSPFTDYNDIDIITIPTPNSIETISSNGETPLSTYPTTPYQPILYFQSPKETSLITTQFFQEDKNKSNENNLQTQYQLLEENIFHNTSDWNSSSDDNIQTNQINSTNNFNFDNYFLSFEELMELIPSSNTDIIKVNQNIDKINNDSSNSSQTNINKENQQKKKQSLSSSHKTIDDQKILFVSGLRRNVTKSDIRHHFIDSKKIIIKQYRTTKHLKYAFISHYTSRQAERNLKRPVNFRLLGSKCRVEYANNSSNFLNNDRSFGKRKLMIARIPENVTKNDLKNLFVNSHLLKYCPAHHVYRSNTKRINKIIWGYAFILYEDEQQADYVIKHADQYKINGQSLAISIYRHIK